MTTTISFDVARRPQVSGVDEDAGNRLDARAANSHSWVIDDDGTDSDDAGLALDADPSILLSDGELTMPVIPRRADEFTCGRCFLIFHRSRVANCANGQRICQDCA